MGCGWGDKALQKCNLSTQCARGLQESIPRPSLLGRVLVFLDALQTRLKAKNLSCLVGSAAILFFLFGLRLRGSAVAQPIASTGDLNNFGVVEKAVENGRGGGRVVEELAPFFDGPVGGHQGGAVFVSAQDDLQEDFSGFGRQGFEAHVINDQQVGFEVAGQAAVQFGGRGLGLEFADQVKDGPIQCHKTGFNGVLADGLGQMVFAQTRRPNEQDVPSLANELAAGQFINLLAFDRGVKTPIEVLQGFGVAEAGQFAASLQSLLAHVQFDLKDQFQNLCVRQLMALSFLQAQFQAG